MAKVLSPKTDGKGVPSPLKNNLWWPGTPTKTKKGKIRRNVAKLPAVISGNEWQRIEEGRKERRRNEKRRKKTVAGREKAEYDWWKEEKSKRSSVR